MKTKSKKMQATLIVAVLLALIVAIFAMAGTTYAKYVTTSSHDTKQVTVAKWGYVVTINADDLFSSDYTYDSTKKVSTVAESGSGVAVKASSSTLAPGTTGEMTFSITGTAEVPSKISFDTTFTDEVYLDDYYPVVWTLEETTSNNSLSGKKTSGHLEEVLTTLKSLTFTEGVGSQKSYSYKLSWNWVFEATDNKDDSNAKDTALGYLSSISTKYSDYGITSSSNILTLPSTFSTELGADNIASIKNYAGKNACVNVDFSFKITVEQEQTV
jgi:hypothetical protein